MARRISLYLLEGRTEADIKEIKKAEISKKVGKSIVVNGRNPGLFIQIIMRAKVILMNLLSKQKLPPKPKITVDITEFRKQKYCDIEDDMVKNSHDMLLQQYLDLGYNEATAEALIREFYRYDS